MVTVTTLAGLVLGGVIGWWVFGHAVGVVLRIWDGLLGSRSSRWQSVRSSRSASNGARDPRD